MTLRPIKKNVTELNLGNGHLVLFSYSTPVAETYVTPEGRMYRVTDKRWSATTTRHIKAWMPVDMASPLPQDYFDGLGAMIGLDTGGR